MPINDINGVDWSSINDINGVAASGIAKVSGVEAPPTYLLDAYTGSSISYSVRRLNSAYTGACMRVREAGSNTETDIGFDSNGYLDTSAIASHCGSNNGFVSKWYSQSTSGGTGSGNDAVQATAVDQMKIYDANTGVLTDNGVAALYAANNTSGTGHIGFDIENNIRTSLGPSSVFSVYNLEQHFSSGFQNLWVLYKTHRAVVGRVNDSSYGKISLADASGSSASDQKYIRFNNDTTTLDQKTRSMIYDGTTLTSGSKPDIDYYVNGTAQSHLDAVANWFVPPSGVNSLFYREDTSNQGCRGYLQEFILFTSDESSNRTAIETDITDYFSIT